MVPPEAYGGGEAFGGEQDAPPRYGKSVRALRRFEREGLMDDFLSGFDDGRCHRARGSSSLRLSGYLQGAIARTNTSAPLASAYSDKFGPSFERSVKAGWR